MIWAVIGGIIFIAIGIFLFLKPDLVWELTESWKSYYADAPSDTYLKITKISGIFYALFGVVTIILPFVLE